MDTTELAGYNDGSHHHRWRSETSPHNIFASTPDGGSITREIKHERCETCQLGRRVETVTSTAYVGASDELVTEEDEQWAAIALTRSIQSSPTETIAGTAVQTAE